MKRACVLLGGVLAGCTTQSMLSLPDGEITVDAAGPDAGAPDAWRFPDPVVDSCTAESMGSTLGEACSAGSECSDGCYCNGGERCEGGVCVEGDFPCTDAVDCTTEVCLEELDRCFFPPQHAMCSDGDACNGVELCDSAMGCRAGSPPYCNDERSCTVDSCEPATGCVFTPRDLDGDGHVSGTCGGDDCDDDPRFGTEIFPGAAERCENRRDDDCDGQRDYLDGDCRPVNDTCELATVLPGAGTYSGSTSGQSPTYTLACRTATGPDSVFRFALAELHDVQVTVSGGGAGVGVALRAWAQCATGPEEKCTTGNPPTLLRRSLPAGEYAIIVQSTTGGAFDLNLRITDPTEVPPVDVCDAGTIDISAGGTFTGMFLETEDDYALSCHPGSYRDAAYRFTIGATQDVTLMASTTASFTPTTYVSIVGDCAAAATTVRCTSQYGGVSVLQRELAAGTYYVLVESSSADASTWSLTASFADPGPRGPGDACSSALELVAATSVSVPLAGLELDNGTTCGGASSSYHDASFFFDLAATSDITLRTTQSSSHYVTLQSRCGVSSSELRCWNGSGTVGQSWRSLPPGRYYVTAAVPTWASGELTAALEVRPPTPIPPNDRCGGAILLSNGSARRDTTLGFEDDVRGGTCASAGYPDAFYSFSLTEPRLVVVNVLDADGGTSRTFLTLRASCTDTTDIQCVASSFGSSSATLARVLDPGDYVLIVETTSTDATDYTISTSFFTPP